MKNIKLFTFFITICLTSCKKDHDPIVIPDGNFIMTFENRVGGEVLMLDTIKYLNDAGNLYSIEMLKYYISNIQFVKDDNSVVNLPNYELIDQELDTSRSFAFTLPRGNYTKVRFLMGVDSLSSVTGAQTGELSPDFGMFWDWNTGYVFLKHEGSFIDNNGDILPLVYHYGTFGGLTQHELTINMPSDGNIRTLKINFDLNKLYNTPNLVDFNNNNIHSGGANWVNTIKENLNNSFSVGDITIN
jgi:hypothetical protein